MNKNIQIFDFQSQEIRVVMDEENNPWFVGKDVCAYFGDTNHKRSLSRIDDDEKTFVEIIDNLDRTQQATAVNESGLYSLIFTFQPEKARMDGGTQNAPHIIERIEKIKAFKRWITHEVIPSIRKTGRYSIQPKGTDALIAQAEMLLSSMKQMKELEEKQAEQEVRLLEVESAIADLPDPHFKTVVGYANEHYISVPLNAARIYGKICTQYSKALGYPIENVPHPLYGTVHAYHEDILRRVVR